MLLLLVGKLVFDGGEIGPARVDVVRTAITGPVVEIPPTLRAQARAILTTERIERKRERHRIAEHRLEMDLLTANPVGVFFWGSLLSRKHEEFEQIQSQIPL
jgi:hypothetical protein